MEPQEVHWTLQRDDQLDALSKHRTVKHPQPQEDMLTGASPLLWLHHGQVPDDFITERLMPDKLKSLVLPKQEL